jgi:hypothetical protein
MPLAPLTVTLSDGQKLAALKRFRARYTEELQKLDSDLRDILVSLAEADFLSQYLGEQPEVAEMRARKAEVEVKERRRQYLGVILERLDQSIPQVPAVNLPPPNAVGGKAAGAKRY